MNYFSSMMDVSTSTVKDQKLWSLSSRPNNFHLSTNSLTRPLQRSSVVTWNNTIFFSLPNLPPTTIPSPLPTPKPPNHSKANSFSSWLIVMLKMTSVSCDCCWSSWWRYYFIWSINSIWKTMARLWCKTTKAMEWKISWMQWCLLCCSLSKR